MVRAKRETRHWFAGLALFLGVLAALAGVASAQLIEVEPPYAAETVVIDFEWDTENLLFNYTATQSTDPINDRSLGPSASWGGGCSQGAYTAENVAPLYLTTQDQQTGGYNWAVGPGEYTLVVEFRGWCLYDTADRTLAEAEDAGQATHPNNSMVPITITARHYAAGQAEPYLVEYIGTIQAPINEDLVDVIIVAGVVTVNETAAVADDGGAEAPAPDAPGNGAAPSDADEANEGAAPSDSGERGETSTGGDGARLLLLLVLIGVPLAVAILFVLSPGTRIGLMSKLSAMTRGLRPPPAAPSTTAGGVQELRAEVSTSAFIGEKRVELPAGTYPMGHRQGGWISVLVPDGSGAEAWAWVELDDSVTLPPTARSRPLTPTELWKHKGGLAPGTYQPVDPVENVMIRVDMDNNGRGVWDVRKPQNSSLLLGDVGHMTPVYDDAGQFLGHVTEETARELLEGPRPSLRSR